MLSVDSEPSHLCITNFGVIIQLGRYIYNSTGNLIYFQPETCEWGMDGSFSNFLKFVSSC